MKRWAGSRRRGAAMLELVITLVVFLMMVLGTLDFGLAVFRMHTVTEAARRGARLAIVHGNKAPPAGGTWSGPWVPPQVAPPAVDPPMINPLLSDNSAPPIAVALRPWLPGSDPKARVKLEWLDGGNTSGQRIRVTVTSYYTPFTTMIFSPVSKPLELTLTSASTMTISN